MSTLSQTGSGIETAKQAQVPLIVVCVVYITLDTVFIGIRFASRLLVRRSKIGWDGMCYPHIDWRDRAADNQDWLLVPSFFLNLAGAVAGLLIAHYDFVSDEPANTQITSPTQYSTQLGPILKLTYSLPIILIPAFTFARCSVLTLYLRIFRGRSTRLFTWLTLAASIFVALAFLFSGVSLLHYHRSIDTNGPIDPLTSRSTTLLGDFSRGNTDFRPNQSKDVELI